MTAKEQVNNISPQDISAESGHQKQRCTRECGGDVKCTMEAMYIEITLLQHQGSSLLNFNKITSLYQLSPMAFLQFLATIILLLGITSERAYSVSHEDIHPAFSNIPRLFYTTSDSNPAFSGYSYTTQDLNGGGSNVVFTTGTDSVSRLRNEINSMKTSETYSQDVLDKIQENLISSKQQSESEEIETIMNKQEDYNLNSETSNEEKKLSTNSEVDNNFVEHQEIPQQITSFVRVPYPIFKENLLNLHFPAVLPRYQVSNVIQNQYYPSNSYARLELPLHNFDFYNPAVPLIYQSAITIPDNSFSRTSAVDKDIKGSTESHVTQKSQINATSSESNSTESDIIKSRSNLELMTNAVEKTSSTESATSINTFESTTYEKTETTYENADKISNNSANPATTTESSVKQITENKTKTELNPLSNTTSIGKYKDNTTEETSTNKI